MSTLYEIIFYTASVKEYANPVLDFIDPNNYGWARVFRDDWRQIEGSFVKDLTNLGRDLTQTVIIDNSPIAYWLNPNNGLPIKNFYDDIEDKELLNLIPILEHIATVDNVQEYIQEQIKDMDVWPSPKLILPQLELSTLNNKDVKEISKEKEKYSSNEVEEFKDSLRVFDEDLKLEDISESLSDKDKHSNSITKYQSNILSKPKGMLARYNEFNVMNKSSEEEDKGETNDVMQIGQGSQTIENIKTNSIPYSTPFAENKFRYKQGGMKNSYLKETIVYPDENTTQCKYPIPLCKIWCIVSFYSIAKLK